MDITATEKAYQVLHDTIPAGTFLYLTVNTKADLPVVQPPCVAYVRAEGNYYLAYTEDPFLAATPYYSGTGVWHPMDIACPRYDRPIHIVDTRWVITNGWRQDLDLLQNYYTEDGIPDEVQAEMSASTPVPPTNVTDLGSVSPGHYIMRVGRVNMSNPESDLLPANNTWYTTSVECLTHPNNHKRKCWNLTQLTRKNPPARFDHVIHSITNENIAVWNGSTYENKTVLQELTDQKKLIPGDIICKNKKIWEYVVPLENELKSLEFARHLTVLNRSEYNTLKQFFTFSNLFILNLTSEQQSWNRQLIAGINTDGTLATTTWDTKHHNAEFCYVD